MKSYHLPVITIIAHLARKKLSELGLMYQNRLVLLEQTSESGQNRANGKLITV